MELAHFRVYSTVLQAHLAQTHGQLIGQRPARGYWVELYAIRDFFVEIWLLGSQQGSLIEVKGFKHTYYLEPYLQGIRLDLE